MSETLMAEGQVKTYRGASIEEVLPQIRAELGPEAVIVRRREGLVGGIGGFFQKRCVEVEARPGGPRIDVYDDAEPAAPEPAATAPPLAAPATERAAMAPTVAPPAPVAPAPEVEEELEATIEMPAIRPHPVRNDAATREGLATPAMRHLVGQARPFADLLDQVVATPPAPAAEPAAEPRRAVSLREGMVAAGLGPGLAAAVVDAVVASAAPFAGTGRLRTLVRDELALRLPIAPAAAPGRRTLAVVGPAGAGKTAAVARIAAAHAGSGQNVACLAVEPSDGGAALRALLGGSRVAVEVIAAGELAAALARQPAELVLVDTPPASPGAATAVKKLGTALKAAGLDEVHLALRAGTAAVAGSELLDGLRPLAPNRLLVTAAAETGYVGGVLDVAIRAAVPLSYVAADAAEIAPAEPRALASKAMP